MKSWIAPKSIQANENRAFGYFIWTLIPLEVFLLITYFMVRKLEEVIRLFSWSFCIMYVLNVKVLFMHLACIFCTTKAQIESIIHVLFFYKTISTEEYFYSFQIRNVTLFEDPSGVLGLYFSS